MSGSPSNGAHEPGVGVARHFSSVYASAVTMACSDEGELSDERETADKMDTESVSVDDEGCATGRGGESAEEEDDLSGAGSQKVEAAVSTCMV